MDSFDSFVFDESEFDDGTIKDYTVDSILAIINEKSYNVDTVLGNLGTKIYDVSAILSQPVNPASYQVDAILALDRISQIFKESIINAIMISMGKSCANLSAEIAMMGYRLKLPYASGDDMDNYWSKIVGLRRRYQESDESYRARLTTRFNIMKSSGTIPELSDIIDSILGVKNAATLRPYWPGELRIDWNNYTMMKLAQSKLSELTEALNLAVVSGITWSTSFPYKEYLVDAGLEHNTLVPYQVCAGIEMLRSKLYRVSADIFDVGLKNCLIDVKLSTEHLISQRYDTILKQDKDIYEMVDCNLEEEHSKDYSVAATLRAVRPKDESVDVLLEKLIDSNFYQVDSISEGMRRGAYLVMAVIAE